MREPALCERWEKSPTASPTFYLKDGLTYTAAKGNATDTPSPLRFVFAFRRLFRRDQLPYAVGLRPLKQRRRAGRADARERALESRPPGR